jgi:hypothetical protein
MIHHDHHVNHVGVFAIAKYEHVMHNHHQLGVDVGAFVIDLSNRKSHTSIYNNMPKSLVVIEIARKMIPNLIH